MLLSIKTLNKSEFQMNSTFNDDFLHIHTHDLYLYC